MFKQHISTLILIATLAACYTITLAPGLTWVNNGADGGDLISAAATGGIAHPTGYPLYLFLARLAQLLPIGTLAYRTNLFSAVCAVLTAWLLLRFLLWQKLAPMVAFIAALTFGTAPLFWSQAVITEVYTLQSLLLVLFLWAIVDEHFPGGEWVCGLIFGLALSNHLTTLFLLPLLLIPSNPQRGWLAQRFLGVALGLLPYLTLPVLAAFHPPVNWGNPVSLDGFWWLVSGQLYADYPFDLSLPEVFNRLRGVAGLLLDQFTIFGVLLGIYGLFAPSPRRVWWVSLWSFVCFGGFAIVYGSRDSQVYLIPAGLGFVVLLAYGVQDLINLVSPKWQNILITVVVFGLFCRIALTTPSVDASHNLQAEKFGYSIMQTAPQNALIFVSGDEQVFGLWYFHYALGQRPDVVVVADELLPYAWYNNSLSSVVKIAPSNASRSQLMSDNPNRPACWVKDDLTLGCAR